MNVSVLTKLAATESEEGLSVLGIDPIAILLQAGTFLILFFLIKKYALDGITKNLDDRRNKIDEGLNNAEEAEKRLLKSKEDAEAEMTRARQEGEKVIEEASKESGAIVQTARDQAATESESKIAETKVKIEQERKKVSAGIQKEAASLVAMATEAIIGEKLDPKKDASLLDKALVQEIGRG